MVPHMKISKYNNLRRINNDKASKEEKLETFSILNDSNGFK